MDSIGPPPHFDGTGFQRWKILMQSHLQAKGLNVLRVTSEGTKGNSQQEKQYDAIAKCAILNSLGENVFNCVFDCDRIAQQMQSAGQPMNRIAQQLAMMNNAASTVSPRQMPIVEPQVDWGTKIAEVMREQFGLRPKQ